MLYAFLDYEEAQYSTSQYGEWIWEINLDLEPELEEEYCYSSGEGDEAVEGEWAVHPWKEWLMYSPDCIKECRLVSSPGCL